MMLIDVVVFVLVLFVLVLEFVVGLCVIVW